MAGSGWEETHAHDPVYGKESIFRVFTIPDGEQTVEFVAGNFLEARGVRFKGISSNVSRYQRDTPMDT